jgi:hypothetical protein
MAQDPNACPTCGSSVASPGTSRAVGEQPFLEHATCATCDAKLVRKAGSSEPWRVDK